MNVDSLNVKTVLVNYRSYKFYASINWVFIFLFATSGGIVGSHSKGILAHSANEFVQQNLEIIRTIGVFSMVVSLFMVGFVGYKTSQSFNLGFLKMDLVRLNLNGNIYKWSEISSLKFIVNSPKEFGERSAKHGFGNWIEFVSDSKTHKYEFYLKTQAMEDLLVELIQQIQTLNGKPDLTLVTNLRR